MSGGTTSRSGFYFQDLVLAERLLAHLVAARKAELEGAPELQAPEFRLEAPADDNETPDWDLVERRADAVVLEEVKRGALTASDRRVLWRRARETLSAPNIDLGRVRLRLTVNRARPPEGVERWRALARVSEKAPATWPTPTGDAPHRPVCSEEDLASEAIHFLTDNDVGPSRPLSEAQARLLLSQFELDDTRDPDGVEDAAYALVKELTGEVGALDVLRAIQGHLGSRAASSEPASRRFTARDLVGSIELVAKLAAINSAAVATWRELRRRSGALLSVSEPAGGLSYQPWRRVQPIIAARLGRDSSCVAVLGRGGQGKSILLRHWIEEEAAQGVVVLWLAATDLAAVPPAQLRAAIDLGAFAARRDGKRLAIALDALEAVGTPNEQLAAAAALALAAQAGVAVSVSCRLVAWRAMPRSQESLAGWEALEMSDWSEELVREQVAASQRPNITADLVKLLRTPLLLDLFVRAFGRQEPVPAGLQSRHGLLRAYWERRVLPDSDPRAAVRRALLVRVAEEEAVGVRAHDAPGEAADDLASEGLFSLLAGQQVFRHVLLRDFTMMMWALQAFGAEVGKRLASVTARLPQFGALRATLEAAFDASGASSRVSAGSIVAALSAALLSDAATVLGELEDARSVDLGALLEEMTEPNREPFLQSLFQAAKVAANPEALRQVTRLPCTEAWAIGSTAVGVDSLLELAWLVLALLPPSKTAQPLDAALRRGVAERLRVWSFAPKLRASLCADGARHLGTIIRAVARLDPSPETLDWLMGVTPLGRETRYWTLTELPALTRAAQAAGMALLDSVLAELYVTAANLCWDGQRLRDEPTFQRNNMTDFDRIEHALVGQPGDEANGRPALLQSSPRAFVPIALALLAGHEADERDDRLKRNAELGPKFAALGESLFQAFGREEPAGLAALEQTAQAVVAAGKFDVEPGELVIDDLRDPYVSGVDRYYDRLILALRGLAERSLRGDGQFFDEIFWPAMVGGSSVIGRILTLDLLTRSETTLRPPRLDGLLTDGRMYLIKGAQVYLQRAIAQRWPAFDAHARQLILRNIVTAGRSPWVGILGPGPLLAAIPASDRPAEFGVFVRLHEERGWNLRLIERPPMRAHTGPREPLSAPRTQIPGMSASCQDHWDAFAEWNAQRPSQSEEEVWARALDVVTRLSRACLTPAGVFVGHHHLLGALSQFMRLHAVRQKSVPASLVLDESIVRMIAEWAIDAAGAVAPQRWIDRVEPPGPSGRLPPEGEVWTGLLAVADASMDDRRLRGDGELHRRLFARVDEAQQQVPARVACLLLDVVRGWMRVPAAGERVLLSLLHDRVRNGRALSIAEHYLVQLSPANQEALLRRWLNQTLEPPIESPAELVRILGQHVGCNALCRYPDGRKPGSVAVAWEVLNKPPSEGLLANAELFEIFVGQLAFGCKVALAAGLIPLERASEYASLTEAAWQVLAPRLEEGGRAANATAFALWVFDPVLGQQAEGTKRWSDAERESWWNHLEPLARAIVDGGPWQEISSLTRLLSESSLAGAIDASRLWPLIQAIAVRAGAIDSRGAGAYWRQALACVSSLAVKVAERTSDRKLRDDLYAVVSKWGSLPLSLDDAAAAAKRIREQSAD